jgi:hypothetical protein
MDARAIGSVQEAELLQRVPPREGQPPGAGDDFGVRATPPAWFTGRWAAPAPASDSVVPAPTTFVETYVMTVVEPQAAAAADLYDVRHGDAPHDDADRDDDADYDDDGRCLHLLPLMHELASRRPRCLPPGTGTEVHMEDLMQCRRRPRTAGGLFAVLRALNGRAPRMVQPRQLAHAVQREQAVAASSDGWGSDVSDDECAQHLAWLLLRSVGVPKDALPHQPTKQAFKDLRTAFQCAGARLGWARGPGCR